VRGVFAERESGSLTLRRGFGLRARERCFVVEDVVTTGGSTRETIEVARRAGGNVLAAGALIDRSGGKTDLGVPSAALAVLDVPAYAAEQCPLCAEGSRPHKPGSR
jgi:orotate phosphoribosyltransferase